jgi:hypothetical protein
MQNKETDHESTVARLRDQIKVLEDLILFLAQQRGPMMIRLADIANHAIAPAAEATVSKVHADDLLQISDATEISSHVRAECHEVDRALTIMLEKQAPSSDSANYILAPAHNQ